MLNVKFSNKLNMTILRKKKIKILFQIQFQMDMGSLRTHAPLGIRKTCTPQDRMCFLKSLSSLHRAVFSGPSPKSTVAGGNLYRMQIKTIDLEERILFKLCFKESWFSIHNI